MAVLATLCATACNGQSATKNQSKDMEKNSKALVVFFSHAGDNYAVGNIEVGNTKIVADYISEITGADQFEIVTHKYDGMAYTPLINLAQEEANKGELPPYEGEVPDLSQYDTVFIGGPIWWGTYPQVMFTFFLIPASTKASVQGGCLPVWQHGSNVTNIIASLGDFLTLASACLSA